MIPWYIFPSGERIEYIWSPSGNVIVRIPDGTSFLISKEEFIATERAYFGVPLTNQTLENIIQELRDIGARHRGRGQEEHNPYSGLYTNTAPEFVHVATDTIDTTEINPYRPIIGRFKFPPIQRAYFREEMSRDIFRFGENNFSYLVPLHRPGNYAKISKNDFSSCQLQINSGLNEFSLPAKQMRNLSHVRDFIEKTVARLKHLSNSYSFITQLPLLIRLYFEEKRIPFK